MLPLSSDRGTPPPPPNSSSVRPGTESLVSPQSGGCYWGFAPGTNGAHLAVQEALPGPSRTGPISPLPLGTLKNEIKRPGAASTAAWGSTCSSHEPSSWPDQQGFSMVGSGAWPGPASPLRQTDSPGRCGSGETNRPQERLTREMTYFGWAGDRPLAPSSSSRGPSRPAPLCRPTLAEPRCPGPPRASEMLHIRMVPRGPLVSAWGERVSWPQGPESSL